MADEVKTEEAPKEAPKTGGTSSGLEPNVAAMLAYLFGWLGGLIFFLLEKDNKFVRFAAMQSLILNVAVFALWIVFGFLTTALALVTYGLGAFLGLLYPVLGIGFAIVWVMLMVKAYQNEEWELPVIGKIARNIVNK
jgi:uncharacterized membrane protein